ncbi:lasso RiPP family leader peptide-containing protein [Saccharopolyspora sp. K220]|nr:lasso RiPP family leader peptide-containing protein [Saccharopolyspora soli]MCI2423724.1 lasso RiPP family leader peptide-containing protein [Saccharopolyspora soli]
MSRKEVCTMDKTYEAPTAVELGNFADETGEFVGPYTEQILPFEDHSNEG